MGGLSAHSDLDQGLSFLTSPFISPVFNFPLFLFGIWATEQSQTNEPLRLVRISRPCLAVVTADVLTRRAVLWARWLFVPFRLRLAAQD